MVILEDTVEIQCAADNAISLHTSDTIDMARLLKSTMRLRPDRIIVGEVRDGAALTLLKAWNTGHPGGITTIHSNTAMSALRRLEQLTAEASQQPMQEVIGEAVDLVVSIERTGRGGAFGRSSTSRDIATAATRPNTTLRSTRTAMSHKMKLILASVVIATAAASLCEPALASSGEGGAAVNRRCNRSSSQSPDPLRLHRACAVAIAGAMLIFGGRLNDFARRLCYVALVGGVLLGATQIVALFGATGASIGVPPAQAEQHTPTPSLGRDHKAGGGSWLRPLRPLRGRACTAPCHAQTC